MSDRALHPALDVGDMIDLLRDGVREVNGISNLDDIRLIQACCEAAELDVNVEAVPQRPARRARGGADDVVKATGVRAAIYVEGDGATFTAQPNDVDVRVLTPEQLRTRDERIIDAAYEWAANEWGSVPHRANTDVDAIIAAAEARS